MLFPITYRSGMEACPKTDNTSQLVLSKGNALYPNYSTRDTMKGAYLSGKMVQSPLFTDTLLISYVLFSKLLYQHHQNWWQIFTVCFLILFLWTIACYSNFQMAGVIVNSSTHVPISPWSIPQTSNRSVHCDCTALIWNIHLTCEVLCCHLPCVNSTASIIEGLGRGWFEAPVLCPVWWPRATWSVWAEMISLEK